MGEGMSVHQALYRKWRPLCFADVCGQDAVTSILKWQIDNQKTSHAYLFCGSRGTGKTTCAKILARAVNCEHPKNGDPCGECPSCRSSMSASCIDIIEMDAASNNGVDDIRQIRDEVEYMPAELKRKVYIIDEVHMLSASAFNALLKTLEEPPAHVIFILATTELQKIPATILSRCQRFDFRRISANVIADRLSYIAGEEKIALDKEAAFLLAGLANGGMRDAISLLELCAGEGREVTVSVVEEIVGTGGREASMKTVKAVADRAYDVIFAEIATMYQSSRDLAVFWQDFIGFYRDMLVVSTTRNARDYLELSDKQYADLCEIAGRFSTETLIFHTRLLDDAMETMRRQPESKRLTAEMTLVRMCDERFSATNEALVSRLAALESKIASGNFAVSVNTNQTADVKTVTVETVPVMTNAVPIVQPIQNPAVKPMTAATDRRSQTEEPATETPVKKEYAKLPYWTDLVDKCTERNPRWGGFMREWAKGYTVNTDNFIHIRATNGFAKDMIEKHFDLLLEILNSFEGGRLTQNLVKLEYKPENTADGSEKIDELIQNSEKEKEGTST